MYSCLTCDVEVESTQNIEELKNIISLLNRHRIACTFFLEITEKNSSLYSEIPEIFEHHEVGLHIHWGYMESYNSGLKEIPIETMRNELKDSLRLLKDIGFTPISFRGGGLCCNNESLNLLKEYNFRIDSSVAAKLNEKEGWYQGHKNVPYLPWYYPSKKSYDFPASLQEDQIGILEVPVTRMIPSGRAWFPYTLSPESPVFKLILNEYLLRSKLEPISVVTTIFHSWGEGRLKKEKFPLFIDKLENIIIHMNTKKIEFITLKELRMRVEGERTLGNG
jgi:hypothetical protein